MLLVVDHNGRVMGRVTRTTRYEGALRSVCIDVEAPPLSRADPSRVVFYRVKRRPGQFRSRFCPGIFRLVQDSS